MLRFDAGACPGFDINEFRPDAGSDAGVDAGDDGGVDAGTTCGINGGPRNADCLTGEACLCGLRSGVTGAASVRYECVRPDARCDTADGSGFADRREQCVTGANSRDFLLAFDGTACPGFDIGVFRPDAAVDSGVDAGIDAGTDGGTTCGIPGGPTNAGCATGEACLCDLRPGGLGSPSVRYECVHADPRCAPDGGRGLRSRNEQCVVGARVEDLVLAFDNLACPGFDINELRPDAGADAGIDAGSTP